MDQHQPSNLDRGMHTKLNANQYDDNMDSGIGSSLELCNLVPSGSPRIPNSMSTTQDNVKQDPESTSPVSSQNMDSEFIPTVIGEVESPPPSIMCDPSWLLKAEKFFEGKFAFTEQNINNLVKKWLNAEELKQAITELWDMTPEGFFGALIYAYHGDDYMVNFAVWIAPSHEVLNQSNRNGQTLLHIAAASCHPWTVRNIFTHGCDLKHKDAWGNNALHVAAILGNAEIMSQLNRPATHEETRHSLMKVRYKSVRREEDVNHINSQGMAPAHIAAEAGDYETLQVLFEVAKADRDIRRYSDGNSSSHLAVESGCLKTLEVCLNNYADSEVRNYRGQTPHQLAYLCGNQSMVQMCQQYGASPNQLEFAETDQVESDCESISNQMMNGFDSDDDDLMPHIESLGDQMEEMSVN